MATIIHLRCHHCGELLQNLDEVYCPPCNIHLAYRAMPFLLGLMLTGHLATDLAARNPNGLPAIRSGAVAEEGGLPSDESALIWE